MLNSSIRIRYARMQIIYAGDGGDVGELERDCIKVLQEEAGLYFGSERCENFKKGGEQSCEGQVFFLYICFSSFTEHCALASAARKEWWRQHGEPKISWNQAVKRRRT